MVLRPPTLQVNQLSEAYGRPVIDDLRLTVDRGEIYAWLGLNGAGKATTLKVCTGRLKPNFGRIWIAGHDQRTGCVRRTP
jgi:ABC-2 type transport system ATP-binding protein